MTSFFFPISEDACEAGSERLTIKATAHAAKVGDVIRFTSGNNVGKETVVRTVPDADTFTVLDTFNTSYAVGDVFHVLRPAIPKRAKADIAASQTDSVLVAAVSGKAIRAVGVFVAQGSTPSSVVFNSKPAGAGTAVSATHQAPAVGSHSCQPFNPGGWFQTVSGEGLSVTTGAGSTSGIEVSYVEL